MWRWRNPMVEVRHGPVLLFETGLPTRCYFDRMEVSSVASTTSLLAFYTEKLDIGIEGVSLPRPTRTSVS